MSSRRIHMLLILTYLLFSAFVVAAKAESERVWSFDWEGLNVRIYSPYQAYAGDNITLLVAIEAEEALQDVDVTIAIHGVLSEGYDEWTVYLKVLEDEDFSIDELRFRNFTVSILSNVSCGLVYGHIYCAWKVDPTPILKDRSYEDSFEIVYIVDKELEELKAAYDSLLGNYTELNSKYANEVGGPRNLMYVFIGTTAVAGFTVLLLVLRRPKTFW